MDREAREAAEALGRRIREEIARRRISRAQLAETARISLSTLEKGLSGRRPFTLATLVRLEAALGLPLRQATGSALDAAGTGPGHAPDEYGGYSRASVAWLEGSYLTLRPSFGERGAVYAYLTNIAWDAAASMLAFREAERVDSDFIQFGFVAVPNQTGHVYLVTNRHGQHRLAVLARPTITGIMHGLLTTLRVGRGSHLSPIATPLVLKPVKSGESVALGRVGAGNRAHAEYRRLLAHTISEDYAVLLSD